MVLGMKVSFSAVTLNLCWGLEEVEDDYAALVESISESEVNASYDERGHSEGHRLEEEEGQLEIFKECSDTPC